MRGIKIVRLFQVVQAFGDDVKPGMVLVHGLVLNKRPTEDGYLLDLPGDSVVFLGRREVTPVLCRVDEAVLTLTREADEFQKRS